MTATAHGRWLRIVSGVVAAIAALAFFVAPAPSAAAASGSGSDIAALANDNLYKSAGTCAENPTTNSLGGSQFETSCTGNDGQAEFWCSDFARWVWANAGYDVSGLDPSAGSFYVYGEDNGTLHTSSSYQPQVGDAVVYDYEGDGNADHVGLVTAVNSDGTVDTANGDFGGDNSGDEVLFATTSEVQPAELDADSVAVGSTPSNIGMTISAYVSPAGSGGSTPPSGNPYSATQLCGSGYGVIDSHDLGDATIYLLYDSSTGDNCVTSLANADKGAVPMNATLAVQGGSSGSDPGSYHWYAGPVSENASSDCVEWGGSYQSESWTSDWSHCG